MLYYIILYLYIYIPNKLDIFGITSGDSMIPSYVCRQLPTVSLDLTSDLSSGPTLSMNPMDSPSIIPSQDIIPLGSNSSN